jgi:NitT/TauT family transport system substrate-binding protein
MMKRSQAIVLGVAACAAPLAARAQAPKIRIGVNPGESLSEGMLAQGGGFFTRAGLDVELVTVPNGGAMTSGIVSGSIDAGPSNVASIAAAYVRGLQLNLFAPSVIVASSAPPTTVIAVAKDSPLRAAKGFNGKIFALSTVHDLQQAAVMTWLDKNGADSKSVQFIEIPNVEQLAALSAKRVDAALLVEPFLTAARNEIRIIARPYDSLAGRLMTFGWIANKAWFDGNPATVQRLVGAIRATATWANRNHDATAAIISSASGISLDTFKGMNRQMFSDGKLDPAMIQPIIDASARYGFLTRAFPAAELFATTGSRS